MIEPGADDGPQRIAAAERLASKDVPCLRCGYNLRGLKPEGVCPECGATIQRSLHGNLLIYSAPQYVTTLHAGIVCILLAILLLVTGGVILFITLIVVEEWYGVGHWLPSVIDGMIIFGNVTLSVLSVAGWWLFSAPDQAILGHDTGDTPRKVLRVTVVVSAAVLVINTVGEFGMYQYMAFDVIEGISSSAGSMAWIVSFFASLLYVRWLAKRLPSPVIVERANQYLWLLPLIFILGFCVVMLGPLIATIIYLVLLNDVRAHLRRIIIAQRTMEADTFSGE